MGVGLHHNKEDSMSFQTSALRKQFVETLKLRDLSERTCESYLWAVDGLAKHFGRSPSRLTEEEVRSYLIYCMEKRNFASSSMRIVYSGIKQLYRNVLNKDWDLLSLLRVKPDHRLPTVLTHAEVKKVLSHLGPRHNYILVFTLYSLGLRLNEGLNLQVSDIDRERMLVHIRHGKGSRDRYVPLPVKTLELFGEHWRRHQNPTLLFPSLGRFGDNPQKSKTPMSAQTIQEAMRRAVTAAKLNKQRVSSHTLRHSYATHLLEGGASLKCIQQYLGHANIETTMLYLHMTTVSEQDCRKIINDLTGRL